MRVLVLVKATEDSEKGFILTTEMKNSMEAMGKFNEELVKAGIMQADDCDVSSLPRRVSVLHSMDRPVQSSMDHSGMPGTW